MSRKRLVSGLKALTPVAFSLPKSRVLIVYICYIDESGTPDVPGNTSHFVLAGISIPISRWREADGEISSILARYDLQNEEFHTAWLLRPYLEQTVIQGFDRLAYSSRRREVERARLTELLRLQRSPNPKAYRQAKKNFKHTKPYIHLTLNERRSLVTDVAQCIAGWDFARMFAECVDKIHFDPSRMQCSIDEQALEQVVSRFEQYLVNVGARSNQVDFGILVHDNNETVAHKHTEMMRRFHARGTLWTNIERIIETPLFVDSRLTRMVQIADLCSYGLRRYVENNETDLFRAIFTRADRVRRIAVGVRHFTERSCACEICQAHRGLRDGWAEASKALTAVGEDQQLLT